MKTIYLHRQSRTKYKFGSVSKKLKRGEKIPRAYYLLDRWRNFGKLNSVIYLHDYLFLRNIFVKLKF